MVGLILALVVAAGVYASLSINSGRVSAPEAARKAAEELARGQGGGEQPKNAQGVPLDATVDPKDRTNNFAKP